MNCGTLYGWEQHKAANTPACKFCKAAKEKHDAGTLVIAAPPQKRVAQCGTPSGAKKHRREHTEMCQPCRDAENGKSRNWKANKNGTTTLGRPVTKPCGTPAAAERHRKNDEPLDEACEAALIKYNAENYQRAKARKKAREAAAQAKTMDIAA